MRKRLAAGAALGILIAFSVYRNGSGMIVSLGAGALAMGAYVLARRLMSE